MSRLGKQPVSIPSGVTVAINDGSVTVTGPKGNLTREIKSDVTVKQEENNLILTPSGSEASKALWGTYAAHLRNMIKGVTESFTKVLEIEGVGYRAEVKGNNIVLSVGFSHPVILEIPAGITTQVEKTVITLSSIDKDLLGQFAANVRKVKKPEPYKGKGIRYRGEFIIRKQGKKAA